MAFGMSASTIRQTSEAKRLPAQLFSYMVWLWGVRNGLLDKKTYLPVIIKAWNAMVKDAVHPNGFSLVMYREPAKNRKTVNLSHTTKFLILRISEQDVSFLPEVKSIN